MFITFGYIAPNGFNRFNRRAHIDCVQNRVAISNGKETADGRQFELIFHGAALLCTAGFAVIRCRREPFSDDSLRWFGGKKTFFLWLEMA